MSRLPKDESISYRLGRFVAINLHDADLNADEENELNEIVRQVEQLEDENKALNKRMDAYSLELSHARMSEWIGKEVDNMNGTRGLVKIDDNTIIQMNSIISITKTVTYEDEDIDGTPIDCEFPEDQESRKKIEELGLPIHESIIIRYKEFTLKPNQKDPEVIEPSLSIKEKNISPERYKALFDMAD